MNRRTRSAAEAGGVYTYDWIENLFGLNMHSARQILPEYQEVKVGVTAHDK